jgi:hypothetical protein
MKPIYEGKKAMLMAFNAAKDHYKSNSNVGEDYV